MDIPYFTTAENQDVCDAVNSAINDNFDLDDVKVDNTEIVESLKVLLERAKGDRELLDAQYLDLSAFEKTLIQIKQGLNHTIEVLNGIIENDDDQPHANTDEATLLDVGDHKFAQDLSTELEARGLKLVKR